MFWKLLQALEVLHASMCRLSTSSIVESSLVVSFETNSLCTGRVSCSVHTHFFALKLIEASIPFQWTPSDPDTTSLASIDAYITEEQNELLRRSVARPVQLTLDANGIAEEATESLLLPASLDLVTAINLIHISPWSATLGLMKAAGHLLKDGGKLYLYGAYRVGGECVESNL